MCWCTETPFSLQQTYFYSVLQLKAQLTTFLVVNYANLQFAVSHLTTTGNTCSHLHFKSTQRRRFSGCMWGCCKAFAGTDSRLVYSRTDCWRCVVPHPPGISVRVTMSQAVHHGQKVVSFAAGAGGLISRLCELSHDLSQLCIGLLVLKDNVIHQSQRHHRVVITATETLLQ